MNTEANGSTLIAHCGTHKITRQQLAGLPVPKGTRTHQPIAHSEIVQTLEEALSFRYLRVVRDEYAVSKDGMKMFGVMDLNEEFGSCRFSIGLRNSNDKSMRLALTAGYRVFVCDNMMFSGDFAPLSHKHTKNLELVDSISIAVDRIYRAFDPIKEQVERMRQIALADEQAKLIIYQAFMDRRIRGIPKHLMSVVHKNYFKPSHEAFKPRNLWSLSNAFTTSFKKLAPLKQFETTARLGTFFSEAEEDFSRELPLSLSGGNGQTDQKPDTGDGNIIDFPQPERDFGYEQFDGDASQKSDGSVQGNHFSGFIGCSKDDIAEDREFDEDDIADDPFIDEEFDAYFDEEAENEALDEAVDEMMENHFRDAA